MSVPPIRAALDDIPVYTPGKPPQQRAGVATYKLSSNENPYPPLPGVREAVADASSFFNRYPDMGCVQLYEALAARLGVPTENLAAGTGSVAVLYHLLQAVCSEGDEVVYAWRSFEAYPIAVEVTGAKGVRVPLGSGAVHDLDAMRAAITDRTRAVLVCTPNNPTGPALPADELRAFVDRVPEDVVVVVDEAYREFVSDSSAEPVGLELCKKRENVVVLRTFSKAYGLAGMRVGYAIAPRRIAEAVRKCALPFGVTALAQTAAVASLDAEDALLERVGALVEERERVVGVLRAQGWSVPDTQANFCWLMLGEETTRFAAECAEAGVMVRPFSGDGVRVTIGERAGNDVFLDVAGRWRAGPSDSQG